MGRWKFFNAFLTAVMLALGGMGMTASADETEGEISEKITSESISETEEISEETTELTENVTENTTTNTTEISSDEMTREYIQEFTESTEEETDFSDIYGNAELVKSEKIIYDTEEMQFIAVTTKDGAVFYILINYSAENAEEQVYFLNKVDTFDLYSLLYMTDDEKEKGIDFERAKQAEESSLNAEFSKTEPEYEIEEITVQPAYTNNMKILLILLGVVVLGGVGFVVFKIMKKPKNKPTAEISEEDDEDYNFYDEEDESE